MMRYVPMMVTCKEAHGFLDDYLAGELPTKQRIVFDWHIKMCNCCKQYLDTYQQSIALCRDNFYDSEEDCEDIPEQIVQGIVAAKRTGGD
ncbi:MAG: hypothetical protein MAG794_01454 [Gammaproteobacteria bacterium]|nr:hypothetical protein [Gammaproteobacteria bacterium]